MGTTTHIIIQARMGSTRLPGKVLMDLAGKPNLWHVIERSRASQKADGVIVATTTNTEDDAIEEVCATWGVPFFRGSPDDVLSRYYETVQKFPSERIVRITADCPFVDPAIIDLLLESLGDADYATNIFDRNFPHGLDAEVMTRSALNEMQQDATTTFHREHVTPYIREHTERFKIVKVPMPASYSFPQFRLTLDTQKDYELIHTLYKEFYHEGALISVPKVLQWLVTHPELAQINAGVEQKHDPTVAKR